MELVHEFTYQAHLAPPLLAGAGPPGTRMIVPVTGGWARGDRLRGTLVGGGADWLLVGPNGFARLDVRGQLQTDDGAVLYVAYTGLLELYAGVQAAMAGGETRYGDQYFRTTPRLETGDPRYAWVNTTLFVARGRIVPQGVGYEVSRVA
jgi:hypothetical protein